MFGKGLFRGLWLLRGSAHDGLGAIELRYGEASRVLGGLEVRLGVGIALHWPLVRPATSRARPGKQLRTHSVGKDVAMPGIMTGELPCHYCGDAVVAISKSLGSRSSGVRLTNGTKPNPRLVPMALLAFSGLRA